MSKAQYIIDAAIKMLVLLLSIIALAFASKAWDKPVFWLMCGVLMLIALGSHVHWYFYFFRKKPDREKGPQPRQETPQ